eukprot:TRINITY_DN3496_c0_g1_i1.p3 TRINITY_DN3496_c0_g1~~TRINITY_DN3496_c0_g1_i1.p3  ORF type:complete len:130 (-),score=2.34 TRINITY_DN3496_c0_g1_i1:814-1203(-)
MQFPFNILVTISCYLLQVARDTPQKIRIYGVKVLTKQKSHQFKKQKKNSFQRLLPELDGLQPDQKASTVQNFVQKCAFLTCKFCLVLVIFVEVQLYLYKNNYINYYNKILIGVDSAFLKLCAVGKMGEG